MVLFHEKQERSTTEQTQNEHPLSKERSFEEHMKSLQKEDAEKVVGFDTRIIKKEIIDLRNYGKAKTRQRLKTASGNETKDKEFYDFENGVVDEVYEKLFKKFPGARYSEEFGDKFGIALDFGAHADSLPLSFTSAFEHFSYGGRKGLIKHFDLYNFEILFQQKGINLENAIDKKLFDGELFKNGGEKYGDDFWWYEINGFYSKLPKSLEDYGEISQMAGIDAVKQSPIYDEYNGEFSGYDYDRYRMVQFNLLDFSDISMVESGFDDAYRLFEKMQKAVEDFNYRNILDLYDKGSEALLKEPVKFSNELLRHPSL